MCRVRLQNKHDRARLLTFTGSVVAQVQGHHSAGRNIPRKSTPRSITGSEVNGFDFILARTSRRRKHGRPPRLLRGRDLGRARHDGVHHPVFPTASPLDCAERRPTATRGGE